MLGFTVLIAPYLLQAGHSDRKQWPRIAGEVAWMTDQLAERSRKDKLAADRIYARIYGPLWTRWDRSDGIVLDEYVGFLVRRISEMQEQGRSSALRRPG